MTKNPRDLFWLTNAFVGVCVLVVGTVLVAWLLQVLAADAPGLSSWGFPAALGGGALLAAGTMVGVAALGNRAAADEQD